MDNVSYIFLKKTKRTCSFCYNMQFYSVRFIIDEKRSCSIFRFVA